MKRQLCERKRFLWVCILTCMVLGLAGCGGQTDDEALDEVKNESCEISFQGRKISGTYSGQEKEGKKHGQGSFLSESEGHRFQYDGEWKDDEISGKGILWDDQFVMKYAQGDRTGTYDGEMDQGEASGDGVFSAVNDDKVSYTYTGGFAKGLFEGKGKLTYDDETYFIQKGNFHEGEFAPDNRELITALGTGTALPYKLSKENGAFLEKHEDLFPAASEDDCADYVKDPGNDLFEDPDAYQESLVKVTDRKVGQVFTQRYWNKDMTVILTWDQDQKQVHYIFCPEAKEDLKIGDAISYYGLPIAKSDYEMEGGSREDCLVIFASYLTAPDGSSD